MRPSAGTLALGAVLGARGLPVRRRAAARRRRGPAPCSPSQAASWVALAARGASVERELVGRAPGGRGRAALDSRSPRAPARFAWPGGRGAGPAPRRRRRRCARCDAAATVRIVARFARRGMRELPPPRRWSCAIRSGSPSAHGVGWRGGTGARAAADASRCAAPAGAPGDGRAAGAPGAAGGRGPHRVRRPAALPRGHARRAHPLAGARPRRGPARAPPAPRGRRPAAGRARRARARERGGARRGRARRGVARARARAAPAGARCCCPASAVRAPSSADLLAWPALHARLALVEPGPAPAAATLGARARAGPLRRCARARDTPSGGRAQRRRAPRARRARASCAGRAAAFTVAGCHGYRAPGTPGGRPRERADAGRARRAPGCAPRRRPAREPPAARGRCPRVCSPPRRSERSARLHWARQLDPARRRAAARDARRGPRRRGCSCVRPFGALPRASRAPPSRPSRSRSRSQPAPGGHPGARSSARGWGELASRGHPTRSSALAGVTRALPRRGREDPLDDPARGDAAARARRGRRPVARRARAQPRRGARSPSRSALRGAGDRGRPRRASSGAGWRSRALLAAFLLLERVRARDAGAGARRSPPPRCSPACSPRVALDRSARAAGLRAHRVLARAPRRPAASTGTTATAPSRWSRDGREVLRVRAAALGVLEGREPRRLRRPALGPGAPVSATRPPPTTSCRAAGAPPRGVAADRPRADHRDAHRSRSSGAGHDARRDARAASTRVPSGQPGHLRRRRRAAARRRLPRARLRAQPDRRQELRGRRRPSTPRRSSSYRTLDDPQPG